MVSAQVVEFESRLLWFSESFYHEVLNIRWLLIGAADWNAVLNFLGLRCNEQW